ncbi:hypothetical protein GCM10010289_68830 [Streptomyces violascens]|nr:hypothetical protein GCM10010289_68830 [Streptomyces violascens]
MEKCGRQAILVGVPHLTLCHERHLKQPRAHAPEYPYSARAYGVIAWSAGSPCCGAVGVCVGSPRLGGAELVRAESCKGKEASRASRRGPTLPTTQMWREG